MSRALYVIIALFAVSACAPSPAEDSRIIRAEAQLSLPKGAEPLSSYNRFYAISGNSAHGVFIWSSPGLGKVTIVNTVKDLPFVIDGGCDVIRVNLDLTTGTWKNVTCQGP